MSRISFPIQITLKDFDDITYNAIYGVRSKSQTGSFSGIDSMYFVVILDLEIIIIYIMLLSDLEKLLSVWENVLSIENVT